MTTSTSILLHFSRAAKHQDANSFAFETQNYYRHKEQGGLAPFQIGWGENLMRELAMLRESDPDPKTVRDLGVRLREALNSAEWFTVENELATAIEDERPVIITVRSNAPELYVLPWELVTIKRTRSRLGELPDVVFRYEWPETETRPESPSPRPEGGRMLVAWSAAGGEVPSDDHLDAIERTYREGHVEFDRERDVVANASVESLKAALERGSLEGRPYALLHLLAHGGARGSIFGLQLDDSRNVVDAARLCTLLYPFFETLRLVTLAACDSANSGALRNDLGSLAQELHRRGLQSVIASRFPLTIEGSKTLTRTLYRSLLVESRSLERAFADARQALVLDESLDWASIQLYARAADGDDTRPVVLRPYRGLEVFERQHQQLFFGRNDEIEETVQEIITLRETTGTGKGTTRMYFVSGASGSGKSSLVRAGVLPRLESSFAAVHIARPGDGCDDLLAERPLLYVVDQSEELFTVLDDTARDTMVRQLHALAVDEEGSVVVFTLRADFIGYLGQLTLPGGVRVDRLEADDTHRMFLPLANREALIAAIIGPARRVGLPLQDGLAAQLVDEVAGEPGSLPLLEFALDRMWERRDSRRGLTHAVYRTLGGAIGALLEHEANAVLDALNSPEEQAQARRILVQLVSIGEGQRADTRQKRRLAELRPKTDATVFDSVLDRLALARLVVTSREAEPRVEIAHEELIRRWGKLREWVDADRQKWIEIERVRGWEQLLRGAQLDRARDARDRYGEDLGEKALAHLRESERVLDEEESREQARQQELSVAKARAERRSLIAILAALTASGGLIVAVILYFRATEATAFAEEQTKRVEEERRNAKAQEVEAKRRGQLARDAARVSAAQRAAQEDLVTDALGMLREVEASSPATDVPGWSATASALIGRAFITRTLQEPGGNVTLARLTPDMTRLVTQAEDGQTRIWDTATGQTINVLTGNGAYITEDGRRVVTRSENAVYVWDGMMGAPVAKLLCPERVLAEDNAKEDKIVSTDAHLVMLLGGSGAVQVVDLSTGAELSLPTGEGEPFAEIAVSPDGAWLVARSERRDVAALWNLSKRTRTTLKLKPNEAELDAPAFTADGARLMVQLGDETELWDTSKGSRIAVLDGVFIGASDNGEFVVTDAPGSSCVVWDARTGRRKATLAGTEGGSVDGLGFSRSGSKIVGGLEDTVYVWDAYTGQELTRSSGHAVGINSARFTRDDKRFITYSLDDGTARMWDTKTGAEVSPMVTSWGSLDRASYSDDGAWFFTGMREGGVTIWDAASGTHLETLRTETGALTLLTCSHDLTMCITSADGGTIHIWDTTITSETALPTEYEDDRDTSNKKTSILAAAMSAGSQVAAATIDGSVWFGDAATGTWNAKLPPTGVPATAIALTADGARVVWGSNDGVVRQWTPETGAISSLYGHHGRITGVGLGRDSTRIASASLDGTVRIWDSETWTELAVLDDHRDSVSLVRFSDDGSRLVTGSRDDTARIYDARTGTKLVLLRGHRDDVTTVDFSADGTRVITGSRDGDARVWDAKSGAALAYLTGHNGPITHAEFDPDGRRAVTTSHDRTARVWDANSGVLRAEFRAHEGIVFAARFDADGRRIATSSDDGTVRVWDAETATQLMVHGDQAAPLYTVNFTSDGSRLISSSDGAVYAWPAGSSEHLRRQLWRATRSCPTTDVRRRFLGLDDPSARRELRRCEEVVRCIASTEVDVANCLVQSSSEREADPAPDKEHPDSLVPPSADKDGDGVLGGDDACPEIPGALPSGCPLPDVDDDLVPDADDRCIDIRGANDDGCPRVDDPGASTRSSTGRLSGGVIRGIQFDYGKDTIKPSAKPALNRALAVLKEFPTMFFEINCHTDSRELRDFSYDLSYRRCVSVRRYFVERGMDPRRVTLRAVGPDEPIDSNASVQGRARNRRVEIAIF